MKFPLLAAALVQLFAVASGLCAEFRNLGFEEANTNRLQSYGNPPIIQLGSAIDLLPGWNLFRNGLPVEIMPYDFGPIGLGFAVLHTRNTSTVPEGMYSVSLYILPDSSYSLSQIGSVPTNAMSLRFINDGSKKFEVYVDNQILTVHYEGRLGQVDISEFAGSQVELMFKAQGLGVAGIDNVIFSPRPVELVPEPSTLVFWVLIATTGFYVKRGHSKRSAPHEATAGL